MTQMKQKNYKSKVNIVLIEIVNQNLGDAVIADTVRYLLEKALPFFSKENYVIHRYNIKSEDYEMLARADLIIFAGGGIIKYKYEHFHVYIPSILECAEKNNIPVYFNGVGIEGYDNNNENCQRLKIALNYSCVKGISVRDDLDTLRTKYLESSDIMTCKVTDPAIFTNEVYGISKNVTSNTIGIGIARSKIFADNEIPEIDKDTQLLMLASLIKNIEDMGYKWKLFVNGLDSDYKFALEVLSYIGKEAESKEYLAPRPIESRELVETIASFKAIVAYRMHANIIAYSLGIPSIGLVWNDKLKFWGERIGYPERFLTKEQFNGKEITDCLKKSIDQGIRKQNKRFRYSSYKPLKKFIHTYGKKIAGTKKYVSLHPPLWQDKLLATALGSLNLRYINMNSPVTIEKSLQNDFRYLETDIRLTTDGRLVCVNGWSSKTYKSLNISEETYGQTGMSYQEFMNCKYYDDHYPVTDFRQLLEILKHYSDWKLIIDIGRPSKENSKKYCNELKQIFDNQPELYQNTIIRVQTKRDVGNFIKTTKKFHLMFYYPEQTVRERDGITPSSVRTFCQAHNIQWISLNTKTFFELDSDMIADLKQSGQKICIFSCQTVDEIIKAVRKGADLVGTHYITVKQMNQLEVFF